jgi:hypothetical protein
LELRENKKMKLLAGFLGLSAGNIVYPSDFDFPSGKVFTIKNIRQGLSDIFEIPLGIFEKFDDIFGHFWLFLETF